MHHLAALLCLIALACAAPAAAQTPIHRCIGANGNAVFTDQPCAALQATPVTASAATAPAVTSTAPPTLCAANLGDLRQSVINAFASRDANRLAGIMLWDGYGRGAAIADIRSLTRLMKQPLLDVSVPQDRPADPAPAASLDDPFAMEVAPAAPPPAGNQLVLHTADNDGSGGPRELRFNIVRQAGCLWLRNAD
ncbi:DUF4124 domain-containing protein [Rhodanobacter ginsengiterrae]|uniref:DUF4124 domain-containing protein n=1 Tax=Rhodanobacter ginsengiterrae TaxID=2008451 RepID=UPI003CEE76BF